MADNTKIKWTDATWNPVTGCSPVSSGCDNCYAHAMSKRFSGGDFSVKVHVDRLAIPFRWKKPKKIFVCSMGDLLHPDVPFEFIDKVVAVMALSPQHTYQVLTKRPERMLEYLSQGGGDGVYARIGDHLQNVWIGVTAENQASANHRIPILLEIPASVRFVSVEPMLGPVDLPGVVCLDGDHLGDSLFNHGTGAGIDWVICGGESGPRSRAMHPDWARSVRDQCQTASVPFVFKQWGGRSKDNTLDGQSWREFPGD